MKNIRITVIVVTLNRPDCMLICLEHLQNQTRAIDEIIVVDASKDDRTAKVVEGFPGVRYLRNDNGFGKMTVSRNIGLLHASGEIIAFVDDDAFAHPDWCENLLDAFSKDPSIGLVGGRVLPAPPNPNIHESQVGSVNANGVLQGNFWAALNKTIEVDHIMGCNMSYRADALARCGGFREILSGISGVAEDSDMCLRAKRLGYRIVFTPFAAVDHIGAPQATGRRFDHNYAYAAGRNYTMMLVHNYGVLHAKTLRFFFFRGGYEILRCGIRPHWIYKTIYYIAGTIVGLIMGAVHAVRYGRSPVRTDRQAQEITLALRTHT